MTGWRCVLPFLLVGACVSSDAVTCSDGVICPQHTVCASITTPPAESLCVEQAQIDACTPLHDHAHCSTDVIANGRCYDGVCLAYACGDGRLDTADPMDGSDKGEVCDDGNQTSGDGCSADCTSTETCGNGLPDPIKGEECDDGNRVDHDGCDSTCKLESARWSALRAQDPSRLVGAAMVYDRARRQLVLFGGQDAETGQTLGDTWVFDGNGWLRLDPSPAPAPRSAHAMAYDSARERVVMYGGVVLDPGTGQATTSDEVWEWDGVHWVPQIAIASPGPRESHAMTYDENRHLVIVYGGRLVNNQAIQQQKYDFGDTWGYDGTSWTQLATTGPAPAAFSGSGYFGGGGRSHSAMTYDATRGKVVLFGGSTIYIKVQCGCCPVSCVNFAAEPVADADTWELDASGWHDVTPGGGAPSPPARMQAGFAYDAVGHRSVLFGGYDGSAVVADEWAWNGSAWTNPTPGTAPPARSQLAMAADGARQRIVVFGGQQTDPDPSTWDDMTWQLAPDDTWTSSTTPTPEVGIGGRIYVQAGAYDLVRGVEVVVDTSGLTYELGATSWTQPGTTNEAFSSLALGYDRAMHKTLLVGTDNATSNPVSMLWDGTSWTAVTGNVPPALDFAQMAYDEKRQEMVLVGSASGFLQQYRWNGTWSQVQVTGPTPDRSFFAVAYDPVHENVVFFGGGDSLSPLGDTWLWDGTAWTQSTAASPGARAEATLAWNPVRQRIILVGGNQRSSWEWDGKSWTQIAVVPGPMNRLSGVVMPSRDGTRLRLFGGISGVDQLDDLWELGWDNGKPLASCEGETACLNPDCWAICAPLCEPDPSYTTCEASTSPRCGDGACDPVETCVSCPEDCGACP